MDAHPFEYTNEEDGDRKQESTTARDVEMSGDTSDGSSLKETTEDLLDATTLSPVSGSCVEHFG